jgi:hypothetical protein
MGLVRICLLLLPLIWAAALLSRRSALEAAPVVLLGIAGGGYLLSLFSWLGAGVWLLRAIWVAALGFLIYSLPRRKRAALPDLSFLLVAAGFAFLWWLARGRQYMIWDEFSHWGMAVKSLFSEGKLVSLTSGTGDFFADYPPALAPLSYLVMRAAGYGFREDMTLYLQGAFILCLLWYPLHGCLQKKNLAALLGGAVLLFFMPLICYPYSYTGILVDCLLGVMGAFLLFTAVFGKGEIWDTALAALAAFVLSGAIKSTGIVFAAPGCIAFLALAVRRGKLREGAPERGKTSCLVLSPLAAALLGKLSWSAFTALYGIEGRQRAAGFTFAALREVLTGQGGYRTEVLHKYFANIVLDCNYGTLLHFPYVAWLAVFALLFWGILRAARRMETEQARAMRWGFWLGWGFIVVFTISVLFSYLFLFAESEAVALASLSRYLNSPLTMVCIVLAAYLAAVLAQYSQKAQLAGVLAGFALWFEVASPSGVTILENIAAAPNRAAQSVNFNRSYRQIAAWITDSGAPEAESMYLVSQQDFGFAYIEMNYQLFPAVIADQQSSVCVGESDGTYTAYPTAESWAQELGENYRYLCLHNINDTFVQDFGALFDDPAQLQNGSLFSIEPQSDGTVHFVYLETLAW